MKFDPKVLTNLREARGLSRKELADQSGVSARTIRRLETRRGEPTSYTCARLSRVLGPNLIEQLYHEEA
jgi:transcriptional regulator with XRE-family HTH domain